MYRTLNQQRSTMFYVEIKFMCNVAFSHPYIFVLQRMFHIVCCREPNDIKDGKGIHVDGDSAWYHNTESGQANQQNTYSPTNYSHVRSGFLPQNVHPL